MGRAGVVCLIDDLLHEDTKVSLSMEKLSMEKNVTVIFLLRYLSLLSWGAGPRVVSLEPRSQHVVFLCPGRVCV